ncbi:MAG: hypothetical protein VBE63_15270 [Lamprobacter sp.]|uniref:hypothetical protein n=1 Tax=Lamprobacter sp. TaxID=3100796 RepID=UPI002B25EE98|nr:hypothetical protein [Lamprobacter sp.]MEA3641284.1 hypothetical protein [Lamprobacter sp.]
MTYSQKLNRHIDVSIDQLNRFNEAELESALAALPGYPDTDPKTIRALAERGDPNARLVIERADAGDQVAQDWL